jgi:hypothetical protein
MICPGSRKACAEIYQKSHFKTGRYTSQLLPRLGADHAYVALPQRAYARRL